MNHAFRLTISAFVLIVSTASWLQAYVVFTPLGGMNIGDTPYWPVGLKETVQSYECVAGLKTEALTWSRGMIITELCFSGDHAKFNAFLRSCAKVKDDRMKLVLRPGKGKFTKAFLKTDPVSFNWKVVVSTDGLFDQRNGRRPESQLSIEYHLGDRQNLAHLDVPPNIDVSAGYDDKYRQDRKDDPAVKAIDAFVLLRNNGKPKAQN